MFDFTRKQALCAGLSVLFIGFVGQAESQTLSSQSVRPTAQAARLNTLPTIDGEVLGDAAWEAVAPIGGFTQTRPNEGQPATQRTEVFVGYGEGTLYIAVMAYDDNPKAILVTDSRRDSPLDDTDSFRVIIDGLLDRQNGYVFGTNPSGMEFDAQVINEGGRGGFGGRGGGAGGFNLNWDTTWEVEAQITDQGWSAEFAIPFLALRYGSGDSQTWGINFQRNIRRNNEESYWAPLDRNFNLNRVSEAGYIEGIEVPSQRLLQFTPYALSLSERGGQLTTAQSREEYGIDVKWGITPSLTLDATVNTDFAQVEVDDIQVNLDRFSLFFPEKRPFFLENAGQFAIGNPREVELFFSRRIGINRGTQFPIEAGARLTGKLGSSTNVGFLSMRTEGIDGVVPGNDFSVVRLNQELPTRSAIGMMFVERQGDGSINGNSAADFNRTYAIDGRWGIGDYTVFRSWISQTETPGVSGDDMAGGLSWTYADEDWNLNAGYSQVGEGFNPEVGFLARRNFRKYEAGWRYRFRPDNWGKLQELRPHMNYRGYWDFDGNQQTGYLHIDNHWEFNSGMEIHTGTNLTQEGVFEPFEIVKGVTVPTGEYKHQEAQLVYWSNQSAPFSVNFRSFIGGFFGGDRKNLDSTIRYRVGEKFTSELTWSHSGIDLPVPGGDFEVDIARFRATYAFSPRMTIQTLVQYNKRDDILSTNLRFAWLQSANAGLYIVYNEVDENSLLFAPREDAQQFAIKYSRILNIFN
ncbi:MAG: DUF5916 domain-containing protein [Pseudomonadota bacterium]|nr:DUF5916 domain-containing protein [Pseudomonadota bacterium]